METFVRDKGVVQAAAIIAEAAAYYKSMKSSLYDRLMILFDTYDYYEETMTSITIKGQKGIEQIS
ncbi:hypothetical protein [Priestia aryabhattai]|uniref:hypothetical protein n=1 Tax=Priestia aryabhattai TaxID=412384 RepID=UPI003BF8EF03